jgi:hypothetical protein
MQGSCTNQTQDQQQGRIALETDRGWMDIERGKQRNLAAHLEDEDIGSERETFRGPPFLP